MQVTVTGKQLDVGDALRSRCESHLAAAVNKYFSNPLEAQVVVTREAHLFRADISVHVGRAIQVRGQSAAADAYAAVDQAVEHVAKRLRRFKRRLNDHHRTPVEALPTYVIAEPAEETDTEHEVPAADGTRPVIIAEMTTEIATLAVNEAVLRLDLGGLPAMLFRNAGHGGLNLVYRRPDGNIGWIDPQGNERLDPRGVGKS